MAKKYVVELTDEEREQLLTMLKRGEGIGTQTLSCPDPPPGR